MSTIQDYYYWSYEKLVYFAELISGARPYVVYAQDGTALFGKCGEKPLRLVLKSKEDI